jgi:hypothetical protein
MWSSKIKSRSAMKISVRATLNRLMGEGLDRHEAIRAIGLVLSEYIYDLAPAREPEPPDRELLRGFGAAHRRLLAPLGVTAP